MKNIGVVRVELAYEIPEGEDPECFLINIELPGEYVEDSFEPVRIETVEEGELTPIKTKYFS